MTEESLLGDKPVEIKPEDYIGEGKKWRDHATLIKAKNDSDSYVKILEARLDDFRDQILAKKDAEESKRAEELIRQADLLPLASNQPPPVKEEIRPTFKPEDIDDLVERKLTEKEKARQEQSNFNTVKAKLKEQLGDDYVPVVRERIEQLGLSDDDFNQMARKSPDAIINILGLNEQRRNPFQAPPQSSGALRGKSSAKRTWSYYQGLKKDNPRAYLDPKIATQMHDDALALGNSFYDGDFGEYTPVG